MEIIDGNIDHMNSDDTLINTEDEINVGININVKDESSPLLDRFDDKGHSEVARFCLEKSWETTVTILMDDCSICLSPFDENSHPLVPCGHLLHDQCLSDYVNNGKHPYLCPLCRAPLQINIQKVNIETGIEEDGVLNVVNALNIPNYISDTDICTSRDVGKAVALICIMLLIVIIMIFYLSYSTISQQ